MDIHEIIRGMSEEKIIECVLELGSRLYEEKQDVITFSTEYRGGDSQNKLWYYRESKSFVDWTGEGSRSLADLAMDSLGLSFIEACKWVEGKAGGRHGVLTRIEREVEEYIDTYEFKECPCEPYDNNVLNFYWNVYPAAWLEEGISKEVMDEFKIRWNWVDSSAIIPNYDYNGNLIGIRQRNFDPDATAKYHPTWLGDTMYNFPSGSHLYGIYENRKEIERCGCVYLVEGEKSVLKAASWGIRNVLGLSGLQLSRWQVDMLLHMGVRKIIFVLDKDWLSDDGSLGYQNYIKRKKKLYVKASEWFPSVYIKQDKYVLNAHDNLFDVGREAFERSKLIKYVFKTN